MKKLVKKGNRIYQVGFAALRNAPSDQEIADYINSFKLIETTTKYH